MNILHLVSNKVWGGGEQYVLDLAAESVVASHDVTIISRNIPIVTGRFIEAGLPVLTMPLKGAIDPVSPFKLARILRRQSDAIIHVHNFKDATVAARARRLSGNKNVRIIMTRHLVKPAKHSSTYKDLDALIFVSQLALDEFMSTSPDIAPEKLHVVHNSIKYTPGPSKSQEAKEDLTLMFHGRISPEKGLDTLIKAMTLLNNPTVGLLIAGTGKSEYENELRLLAEASGVDRQIQWLGHIDDIHSVIEKADIGICPSRWREPFGLAVIEYMAHGKPVITTDNGAQREYITSGKDGILIPPDSPEAIAGAIQSLADASVRDKIGTEAFKTFLTRLSYPNFFKKICSIYTADQYKR